ncbi:hypothetical protein ACWT_4502 [Actinoplanes sp. SE50]|uniref:DUF6301 family protein n=1 Tax=unclassified Actinoplanes TaxID=2626549 RepID=UPI00023ED0A7|nr:MULTISPECIES: DUF6301 family protein [unclassified Actinoplanes]AEV85524.1 hypothetical protein ACPL_4633 [Actinoplanes sp. SE50/110]ATO83917.1 hypothetical protein ACWT_4502 [Actinoplanes sp. SE50]SLM01327.1 uncharacterized protein ACSP50_4563 [Actinoplanes sp. SE50/110]
MSFTRTDDAAVRDLLTALRDVPWHWRLDELDDLAARLGWQITDRWDKGAEFTVGWPLPSRGALLTFWKGGGRQMDFDLTARTDDTPETDAAADDAFADFAAIATDVLGRPDRTTPGIHPSVAWRTADSTFELAVFLGTVTLTWSSNAYQQFLRDTTVADPADDGDGDGDDE